MQLHRALLLLPLVVCVARAQNSSSHEPQTLWEDKEQLRRWLETELGLNETSSISNTRIARQTNADLTRVLTQSGLTELDGRLYYFSRDNKLVWSDASLFCQYRGMFLAAVESSQRNNLLSSQLSRLGQGASWLGGNNQRSNVYRWVFKNRAVSYTNWNAGEPATATATYRCIVMSGGKWYARFNGQELYSFICEF